ncbi:C4-dicarboxylate TRAP transporter substrate-binding protein [Reyranella sp.]|uniref:C4-dicarboxylate TRAP transporter substrate-binding protein n=1 Tax=Reyranella sp. TaxID=1929291 RepID=UPI003BAB2E72
MSKVARGASIAVLSVMVSGLAAGSAGARELIYVSNIPAKHPTHAIGLDPYFEAVTKATGGSLTFKSYPGGTVAGGKTAVNAVQNGTADMALIADVYTPNDLPVSTLVSDLAVLGKDARVMTGAVNQTLLLDCASCKQDYLRHKVLPLASYSLTPYHFLCSKSGITKPEDVKGRKIRGTGSMGQLVAALGGTPVNITSGEIYEAMQRGQIDCSLGPMPWLRSYSLWDMAKFVTSNGVGTYHGTNFINIRTDTWKKLSPKERQAMADGLPHATRLIAEAYEKDDDNVVAEGKAKGVEMVEATPALEEAVAAFRDKDIKRVIETAKSRGVKDAEQIVEQFKRNVEQWTKLVDEIGKGTWTEAQWDKYEALLKSQIFAKVKYP